jgi:hypothetical protein
LLNRGPKNEGSLWGETSSLVLRAKGPKGFVWFRFRTSTLSPQPSALIQGGNGVSKVLMPTWGCATKSLVKTLLCFFVSSLRASAKTALLFCFALVFYFRLPVLPSLLRAEVSLRTSADLKKVRLGQSYFASNPQKTSFLRCFINNT